MFKHIIIPTDGSEIGTRAVKQGIGLAQAIGARVTILTVLHPERGGVAVMHGSDGMADFHARLNKDHQQDDDRVERDAQALGVSCRHLSLFHSQMHEAVRQTAEAQDCDLIVMPAHERKWLLGRAVDSDTVKLLSNSGLPVLVMH